LSIAIDHRDLAIARAKNPKIGNYGVVLVTRFTPSLHTFIFSQYVAKSSISYIVLS
jgi:hypothetical protein